MEGGWVSGGHRHAAWSTTMTLMRCPWYVAGPLLGLVIVALRAAMNKPLGVVGGYIDVSEHGLRPRRFGFGTYLLLGFVLGGTAFALTTGTFSVTFAYPAADLLPADVLVQSGALLIAGIAMGFGARTAGGCTSGHGLSGMSLGSPASIVSSMTFFGSGVVLAHLLAGI
jgi:uncharacterized membrane protein YedE/YeeE